MDHVTGWITKDGKRLLLCQPYNLYDIASVEEACREHNLQVNINGCGWYGHGTIAIELTVVGHEPGEMG